jgi:hypothetical protein
MLGNAGVVIITSDDEQQIGKVKLRLSMLRRSTNKTGYGQ